MTELRQLLKLPQAGGVEDLFDTARCEYRRLSPQVWNMRRGIFQRTNSPSPRLSGLRKGSSRQGRLDDRSRQGKTLQFETQEIDHTKR